MLKNNQLRVDSSKVKAGTVFVMLKLLDIV
jgi:hypothetical protein